MVPPTARSAVRVAAYVVAVLSVLLLTVAGTARSTVLARPFYQQVLDDQHAYDRLYDQVLVDPAAARVTRDLLAHVPVPEAVVTANLKNVLPPSTLRALTDQQIGQIVAYLRGDTPDLRMTVDLTPVLDNIGTFARLYLGDLVAGIQGTPTPDFGAFTRALEAGLSDIAAGRPPPGLPALTLDPETAARATDVLVGAVPAEDRDAVRPEITAALATGDVASALAIAGPYVLGDQAGTAGHDLETITENGQWDLVPSLKGAGVDFGKLTAARNFTRFALGPVQGVAVALGVTALAVLWFVRPDDGVRAPTRRLARIGWTLAAGGALAMAAFGLARLLAPALLTTAPGTWPPSLARLADDLQADAARRLTLTGVWTALVPLAIGLGLVAGVRLWEAQLRRREQPVQQRRHHTLAIASGVFATAAVLLGATLVPIAAGGSAPLVCNGSARLCNVRYDRVAVLATHNSMSSTADSFIGPLQDPDIVGQLNAGARGLLVDTHYWESPDQIQERLDLSDFSPEMRAQIDALIDKGNPPRPGTWLCHAVCRAGAVPLTDTLRSVGTWLDRNPGEVVTMIVQDAISPQDTAQAFHDAGLDRVLYTPDENPDAPWPTLGAMVRSGKRLVVFAEQADGPAPWYRNFYRYGMETPFDVRSPADFTCSPFRGGTGKQLFLLNNFVTNQGGSRIDAGTVNSRRFIVDRARACEAVRGHPVTFVAVDFASVGEGRAAVDELNSGR